MRRTSSLTIAMIAVAATSLPQIAVSQTTPLARPEMRDLRANQKAPIVANILRERQDIRAWPSRDVTLATPPLWIPPSRRPEIRYTNAALAVERVRRYLPTSCEQFYDRIDLRAVRQRGFRLFSFSAIPYPTRPEYSLQSPVEAIAVDTGKGDVSTASLVHADQIRIRPAVYTSGGESGMRACASGYRLMVTLEGPKGVDPFPTFSRPRNHRPN